MRSTEVRYASSDGASIAYQVVGDGPFDVLFVPGFVSHIEVFWEEPSTARFFERLASFARVILFDKREQGLSDRFGRPPTVAESVADVAAVMDAAGSAQAALYGISEGGPLAFTFAATHPERVRALVAYGTFARLQNGAGYTFGWDQEVLDGWQREVLRDWGSALSLHRFAPTLASDARFSAWWARLLRVGTSPRGATSLFELHRTTDVRDALGRIEAPTLVVHRTKDRVAPIAGGRFLAEEIRGARLAELPGSDHLWMAGDQDALLDEVEEFLTGQRVMREPTRALRTLLFVDIVGSTARAGDLGDRRWRDLLGAYDARIAALLDRHGGRLVKKLGDGSLATFEEPARAIRCAVAVRDNASALGLELRAGVHTGECELLDGDVAGMAVHIGARVGAAAEPGEVLVSNTVRELVAGSELRFEPRGEQELRGVPGRWALWSVAA